MGANVRIIPLKMAFIPVKIKKPNGKWKPEGVAGVGPQVGRGTGPSPIGGPGQEPGPDSNPCKMYTTIKTVRRGSRAMKFHIIKVGPH